MFNGTSKSTLHDGLGNRREGKVVMEWKFSSSRGDKTALVRVRLRREYAAGGMRLQFVASSTALNESVTHTDINALYDSVREILDRNDDMERGVTWADWLEIKVHGKTEDPLTPASVYGRCESTVELTYSYIKRGTTEGGRAVTINGNGIIVDFPKAQRLGELQMDDWRPRDSGEIAYVPATPENVAAVERLVSDIGRLRERIADLCTQETIAKTLQAAAANLPLIAMKDPQ